MGSGARSGRNRCRGRDSAPAGSAGGRAGRRTAEPQRCGGYPSSAGGTGKSGIRGDDIEYVDADLEFHRAVVAAVHNPLLDELFDSFSVRMREAMLALLAGSAERPHDQEHHQWLFDAIVDGSTRRAVELATDQLQHVRMR